MVDISFVEVINLIFSFVIVFVNFIMFKSLNTYKKIRSKEDNLFLQKTLFNSICFTYYMILFLIIVLVELPNDRNTIMYQIQEYLYNIYIVAIYLINLFMSFDIFIFKI